MWKNFKTRKISNHIRAFIFICLAMLLQKKLKENEVICLKWSMKYEMNQEFDVLIKLFRAKTIQNLSEDIQIRFIKFSGNIHAYVMTDV